MPHDTRLFEDTSPQIAAMLIQHWRDRPPLQKLARMSELMWLSNNWRSPAWPASIPTNPRRRCDAGSSIAGTAKPCLISSVHQADRPGQPGSTRRHLVEPRPVL